MYYQFCLFFHAVGRLRTTKTNCCKVRPLSVIHRLQHLTLLAETLTSQNRTFRTRGGHGSVRNWCPARWSRGQIPKRHQVQQRVCQQPETSQTGDWDLISTLAVWSVSDRIRGRQVIKITPYNDKVLCFYSGLKCCYQGVTFCFCVPSLLRQTKEITPTINDSLTCDCYG